jgi:hypothetical protein
MTTAQRNTDTWNDSQDDGGDDTGKLLQMIRDLADATQWYTSFYNDVTNTTPEYFENCGDLNAVLYLHAEAQAAHERARALLEEYTPAPETEPDYSELPL